MSTEQSHATSATQAAQPPRRIDEFLKEVLAKNGSDLHFIAGDPPRIRLYGELHNLRQEALTAQYVEETLREIMPRAAQMRLEEKHGADFAYIIPGVSRFRVNVMRHLYGLGCVCRAIPSKALTLDQLGVPQEADQLLEGADRQRVCARARCGRGAGGTRARRSGNRRWPAGTAVRTDIPAAVRPSRAARRSRSCRRRSGTPI